MVESDYLYYILCGWAGLSMAFVYVFLLDRFPSFVEVLLLGFVIQRYIDTVTIPFLEENSILLPGFGHTRIASPGTGIEDDDE